MLDPLPDSIYIKQHDNGIRYFTEAGLHFRQLYRLLVLLKVTGRPSKYN